ncbi:MAG: alpha/beta hydrolase [Muribaculaceae bacterium]|nr:alpha/beta hydrolase [Muribaculaceae bacterium]
MIEGKDYTVGDSKLHVEVSGSGHPLILMHGWGCNHSTVRSIAATAEKSHRVYNVDFPGFGDSPEPADVWSVYDYADLIENFIRREGLYDPVLVGHSFGGRVAIILGSRIPVSKIILVDAAGIKPRRTLRYYYKVYSFKAAKAAMKLIFGKEGAQKRIDRLRAKRGSSDYAQATPRMRAIMSRVVNEDLTPLIPKVKAPTLLIWGENDTATPLADAKKMNSLLPDSGLVSFPGCGHYSFLDNPGQFARVLASFLQSTPQR